MKNILIYIFALLMPVAVSAQALPFVAADYSAGAMAKAGSNATETSSTAFASFENIAAVPYSDKSADLALGYTLWQPSSVSSNVILVGGSYNLADKLGFALGMTYGMLPEYDIFNDNGSHKGTYTPSDVQVNAGASWRFLPFLSAGVNLGYASSSLAEGVSYGAFNVDVFLMSKFADYKVALGLTDLGSAVVSASDVRFSLPSALTLGLGYDKTFVDVHKVDVALDLDYYFDGHVAASIGADYTFNNMISFLAGYRYGGNSVIPSYASLGLGGRFFGVNLDLAYVLPVAKSPMSNTLSLAVGYSF